MENRTRVFEAAQYISMHEALTPELLRHYYPDEFGADDLKLITQQGIEAQIFQLLIAVCISVKRVLRAFLQRTKE